MPRLPRFVRWIAPCLGLAVCGGAALAQTGCVTTITGKVYSPLGPTNGGDPIPNILVYIPQTAVLPFSTTVGAGVTGGCTAQANLVSGNPLVNATTDAAGSFTLTTAGLTTGTYNVVIQAGKWRRQYPATAITACQTNNINAQYGGGLTMPSTTATTDGTIADLPHIAVVTGSADSIECIFHQIGISDSEVTDPSGTGSINLFKGGTKPGEYVSTGSPTEAELVGVPTTLSNYDVVIFGCQGTTLEVDATMTNQQNMVNYANQGGRIFATHYGYNWLYNIAPFSSSAAWDVGSEKQGQTGVNYASTIDQSYAEGVILAQWLQNIGASYNGVKGQIGLQSVRNDTTAVNNPPAQNWVSLNSGQVAGIPGTPSMQFTFNTPVGASTVPTVAITYTNSTTFFQPRDPADNIIVDVTNNSTSDASSTLVMTIAMPGGLTVTNAIDNVVGGGWTCGISGGGSTVTCTRTTPLAAGAFDKVSLTFSIASTVTLGQSTITASLSGGNLSSTGQCGRVLFNDYHVETTSAGKYPEAACLTALTPQERFLEFSLYNLSNFIAPVSSDVILIQGTPIINWPTPAAIPYGEALSGTQLDASATFAGTAVAGTFAYTPAAGTILPLGNNTLSVVFTPTNTTNYTTAMGSVVQSVVQDTSSVVLTSGTNPSYLGESVTFTAQVSTNGAVAAGQTVNFFDGLTQIGSGTTNAQGAVTYATAALIVGTHNVSACIVASADFGAACSPALIQLVTLIPTPPLTTSTVLTSNANPATLGQNVTFTVGVATTGAFSTIPTGTVTFYDGGTALGPAATLSAAGFATISTSGLALGTHTITAVYGGSKTLAASTSNVVLELILTGLPSAGTGFLLTVDPVTLTMGVGESKVLNIAVIGLNNYQEPVNLTCTGAPAGASCNFGKAAMPVGGGVTTLTFGVAAPHACGTSTPYFVASNGMRRGAPWLAMSVLGLLFVGRRRKRLMQGLTLALALCVLPIMGMLSGCGGACTDFGTQPGTYQFTITATPAAGTVAAQTQLVTVNVHL